MRTGYAVRVAGEGDAAAIGRLHLASYRAAYRDLLPPGALAGFDPGERERRWRASLTSPSLVTYVAADETGGLLGFAETGGCRDADLDSAVTGELMALHVGEACWRRGIGRALHARAAAGLAARGFTGATLWVLTGNERAAAFYTGMGWSADGHTRHHLLRGAGVHETRYRTEFSG